MPTSTSRATRISLVGYRGCGKTTVGRLLAARLAWRFVDLDQVLEPKLGMTIAKFFAEHGEGAFRDAEAAALGQVLETEGPMVLATGGGAVLRDANRELLRQRGGLVVYLDAPLAVIQERLRRNAGDRPSLTGAPVAEEAARLLTIRDPLYREVATKVIVPARTAGATAAAIAELISGSR